MLMATRYGCNMQQIGLCLAIAFILSSTGVTVAQTQAPTPGVKSGNLPLVISLDAADCRRLVAQSHSGQIAHRPDAGVASQRGTPKRVVEGQRVSVRVEIGGGRN